MGGTDKPWALAWVPLPPLIASLLLHLADADVGGWSGVTPSVAVSILVLALPVVVSAFLCVSWLLRRGWPQGLLSLGGSSVLLAMLVVMLVSQAVGLGSPLQVFFGCLLGFSLVQASAVLPAAAVLQSRQRSRS